MRKLTSVLAAFFAAAFLAVANAPAASAATGAVHVFELETIEITTYQDPEGCHKLPIAAHVLVNRTDEPVRVYGDPFCLTPSLTVQPNYGSHITPGSGSFSA